jgi:23S rRNA pseudouridine1911/1915/1917 synthase
MTTQSEADDDSLDEECADHELRLCEVPAAGHGQRLDRVLADLIPEMSRSYLQQQIECGCIKLNGGLVSKPALKLRAGDQLSVELRPTPQTQAFKPQAMPLNVVYEDAHLLVINKPAGLVVHPAPGNWSGTLLNGLLAYDVAMSMLPRAGIVHRLDKDTSGLMVVARTRMSMDLLVQAIAGRTVRRQYLALAHRAWAGAPQVLVEHAVGRDPRNRLRMAVVDLTRQNGKTASTTIRVLSAQGQTCLVECTLQTGRTHQIRVHMASLGHPLLADVLYGGSALAGLTRQALHAFRLAFKHPLTGEFLEFTAPLPIDMSCAMQSLGLSYNPCPVAGGESV